MIKCLSVSTKSNRPFILCLADKVRPSPRWWWFVCLSVLTTFPLRISATEQVPNCHQLRVEEGLSDNWVLSILRDQQGFLWVGTQNGLNRYDGQRFVTYLHSPDTPHTLPAPVAGVEVSNSAVSFGVGSR